MVFYVNVFIFSGINKCGLVLSFQAVVGGGGCVFVGFSYDTDPLSQCLPMKHHIIFHFNFTLSWIRECKMVVTKGN